LIDETGRSIVADLDTDLTAGEEIQAGDALLVKDVPVMTLNQEPRLLLSKACIRELCNDKKLAALRLRA